MVGLVGVRTRPLSACENLGDQFLRLKFTVVSREFCVHNLLNWNGGDFEWLMSEILIV